MWSDDRFKGYSLNYLRKDIVAGIIVGIVALPLAMAFAIASGVRPEYGIYTTIIAGFLVAIFGGSRFQIAGPTGAFVPILYALVAQYGYENLLIIGFMAGILIALMGICKLGTFIHYIPKPVTVGFTAGIAVLIFAGQLPAFLGLHHLDSSEEEFIFKFKTLLINLTDANIYSLITATICLASILLITKYIPRIPGALIGLLASTLVVLLFYPGKVTTIGSVFGMIPHQLPHWRVPEITFAKMIELFIPACMVAMLGGIESLLCAVVADGMSNSKHRSNRELIGQGLANMVTPMFGGIPATGAIARTATNIRNGAISPVSAMVHSLFILLVLLAFSSYASHIPLASMAPILMVVAWNMGERKDFLAVLKSKSTDSIVLVTTFLLTICFDLVVGVSTGLALSFVCIVIRMSKGLEITFLPDNREFERASRVGLANVRTCVIKGPIFFGTAKKLEGLERENHLDILVISLENVSYMDTTGEDAFRRLVNAFQQMEHTLILTDVNKQTMKILKRISPLSPIGDTSLTNNRQKALRYFQLREESNKHSLPRQEELVTSFTK